jgi:amidohydrolase
VIDVSGLIQARQAGWIARRRDLHQRPELAFNEIRTAGIVTGELTRLGLEVQTGIGQTGVLGILEGAEDGPTVLVRADMDALPVHEENSVDYVSRHPGVMHACGHDGHTTIALAVAEVLSEHRAQIRGRVKFVFQPAEEIAQGASAMIADGALLNPAPDVALGLHLWNELPMGTVAMTDGAIMAGASDFTLMITGQGGHGGLPHETRDPILAASQIVTALQSIVSRNVKPTDVAVISVTAFQAGEAFNVIPPRAVLRGTVRTLSTAVRDVVQQRMGEVAQGIAAGLGCTAALEIEHLTPPVTNARTVNDHLRRVFAEAAPEIRQIGDYVTMAAEDMAFFLNAVPGAFFLVGSSNTERGLDYPHHHPQFDFDEAAIPLAVRLMTAAVASYVMPE